MRTWTSTAVGAIVAVSFGFAAQAETAALATFLEPNHIITRFQNIEFADNVREATNGGIDIEVFSGGALLPAMGTLDGVANGVAQIGVHAAAYTPSQLPVINAIADLGFLNPDPFVLAFAYSDFVMNEAVGYDDWRKNGVVFGGGHATPPYRYLCKGKVTSLDELVGKRVRMPGGGWARFGEDIGLVPVNMPASEIYTGMERGALDCLSGDVTHLETGASIGELVDSIITIDLAPAFTSGGILYDVEFWQSLNDDQRRILMNQAAISEVRLQIAYAAEAESAMAFSEEKGIEISAPDDALTAAYSDWIENGVGGMVDIARDTYGIEEPEKVFATFKTYLDKWSDLTEGVDRSDEKALISLVKTELFDKIDVSSYGMD